MQSRKAGGKAGFFCWETGTCPKRLSNVYLERTISGDANVFLTVLENIHNNKQI